jgi:hypothetical protein
MSDTPNTPTKGFLAKHAVLERSPTLLLVCSLLVVTVGGIVEIAPLFYLENTIEEVEGVRPYSPLELAGRDIYIREGCIIHWQRNRCTTTRTSGAPNGRGRIWPVWAASIRMLGTLIT